MKEFLQLLLGIGLALLAVTTLLGLSARWLAPRIPFEWELALSPPLAYVTEAADLGSPVGGEQARAIRGLGNALLETSLQLPADFHSSLEPVAPEHFSFHLIDSEAPNAFATLGAQIAVTSGLLSSVNSENGLAMVMAHEIAHVQLRHPVESAGRGVLLQMVIAALTGISGNELLSASSMLAALSFSRDMELAADERALEILLRHYGHLGGADELFAGMNESEAGSPWLEFTRTHPSSERRLQHVRVAMLQGPVGELTRLPTALSYALARNQQGGSSDYLCGDLEVRVQLAGDSALLHISGQQTQALSRVRSASGIKYAADNTVFWMKGSGALLMVGDQPARDCLMREPTM